MEVGMRKTTGVIRLVTLIAILSLALAVPAKANGSAATTDEPTLSLQRACYVGYNSVDVILTGFPPSTPFEASLEFDGAGIGPIQLTTDVNGDFNSATIGHIGSIEPTTFTATITWEGGVLTESLFVDCSKPASKEDCKAGGWRNFPQFNDQGDCIAFVNRGR
jgi:hypothetical protein